MAGPSLPHDPDGAMRAWLLGPRAENADLFERLVTEALRDHVFWRRNHHPEDGFTITEADKRRPGYDAAVATMKQELLGLLAELKQGVPFFSGRYKGHMNYEQTMASQIGYFAAMLFNPNNVAVEGSPVTTRLELKVARQLAEMVGYDPAASWGHLTGGGTVANLQSIWVARNLLYFPLAAYGTAAALGVDLDVALPEGGRAPITSLDLWRLLNISNDAALDLWERLWAAAPAADVRAALDEHSLQAQGYQEYGRRIAHAFPDPLPPGVVIVSATAHYSWEKIVRALGIGSNQLVYVPVDHRYRIDPDALWETIGRLTERRQPILACVTVNGTTEESAVDRLDRVLEVRERAERELGVAFHLHSDSAYGGYAAAVTRAADGSRRTAEQIRASTGIDWPDEGWVRSMEALAQADSITIDPHKLGYVPYPAGAFLLRDRRARALVSIDPPYLQPAEGVEEGDDLFLGKYIFEGSKPGAAAAAVWLSHQVLPLDERGYGHLVERTVVGARRLYGALREADLDPFRLVLLPEPDINIVCYIATHPACADLQRVNALNEGIYARMSLNTPGAQPEYIITRTRFTSPMYDGAVVPLLDALGVSEDAWRERADGLVVLRSTVMDPFLGSGAGPDHARGFVEALGRACEAAYAALEGV
ncbi:MAG: decarboxylase [Gemmatimonadetes bacterium]|nr:MAG: decarboxylase [Gemmatimonadota bacterium]